MLKPLPTTFKYNDYIFRQLKKSPHFAVYEVDNGTHYEVIRIRTTNPLQTAIKGQHATIERYPSSLVWGKDGWTFYELQKALAKFETLERNYEHIRKYNQSRRESKNSV